MHRVQVHGFTLLDLLVSLAIVSIIASIATPALGNLIESSRSKAVRQQLQALLAEARSEALTRSRIVTICHLNEGGSCTDDLEFPLTMFIDTDRSASLDDESQVLRELDLSLSEQASISWNRSGYVRFWPSGGTGALTGSISYCLQDSDKYEFRLVIARTGRVRVDLEETRCD